MADNITFLFKQKGIFYFPEDDTSVGENITYGSVKSLADLSAEKISLDSTSIKRALRVVPHELYYNLMKAALVLGKDRSVEVLISNWPWKVLQLSRFAPPLFHNYKDMYHEDFIMESMRKGIKYTTCLAHTFVECLKKRAPTELKCLDLTGFPAAEVIVNYLASHVLLVHNEIRQKEIITLYDEITQHLPVELKQNYNLDTTLPEDSFFINIDAFLQTNETHMELCKALKTSKLPQCKFKIRVTRIDLTNLGVARICVMLDQIDKQYLKGLCLQYNAITNPGLTIIGPALRDMPVLVALDLSCNNFNLLNNEDATENLSNALGALPSLQRLDLSSNRLKYKLRRVLSFIQKGLVYLRLCGCGLMEMDLRYLRISHHSETLKELDISENNLGRDFDQVCLFLEKTCRTLTVFELEDCDMEILQWHQILELFPKLPKLRYLNIAKNKTLNAELLLSNVTKMAVMSQLDSLKVSYPLECYMCVEHDHESISEERERFKYTMQGLMDSCCEKQFRYRLPVIFTS